MIVVVDLEATCWNDGTRDKPNEIIEIGAVKVDLQNGIIVDRFQAFIKPKLNPTLSNFCKELTHITQEDVDRAESFDSVYWSFIDWYGSKENTFASWGNYDRGQMKKDCSLHGLKWRIKDDFLNVKTIFAQKTGLGKIGLGKAVAALGLEFSGTPHRAISDAENAGRVLIRVFHNDIQV